MINTQKLFEFLFRNLFNSSIYNFKKIILSNEFYNVRKIFEELNSVNFDNYTNDKHSLIYNFKSKDIYIKQIISKILLRQPLIRLVFSKYNSKTFIRYPLPNEYQGVLIHNKYKVSSFISSFLWNLLAFFQLCKSIIFISKFILSNLISFFKINENQNNTFYFVDLNIDNLPLNLNSKTLHLFTHFLNIDPTINDINVNFKFKKKFHYNNRTINIEYKSLYPKIKLINHFYLISTFFYLFFKSFIMLLSGRWCNALILEEYIKYKIFELSDTKNHSKHYLFSNTSILFRPLWTYSLDKNISKASVYFYSLSDQPICNFSNKRFSEAIFKNINWTNYFYWNDYHLHKLKKYPYNFKSNYTKCSPILFGKLKRFNYKKFKKYICVFDIEPYNINKYIGYSTYNDYGHSINIEYVNKFLIDIIFIANKYNYMVVHKPKRKSKLRLNDYSDLLNNLKKNENYYLIDESTNPLEIIESSKITISAPFTSTGLLAKHYNIRSIYYDPSKKIFPEYDNSGVELIRGPSEINEYFKKLH